MIIPEPNLVPRACDPREGTRGSGINRLREESDWPLKWMRSSILARIPGFRQRIIPEPRVPSRGSQARGMRLPRVFVSFPRIAGSGNEIAQSLRFLPKDRRLGERDWIDTVLWTQSVKVLSAPGLARPSQCRGQHHALGTRMGQYLYTSIY
jgi:hypothetical protein